MQERIFCVGDLHLPYCHKEKVSKMLDLVAELKPTIIIQLGDLYDMYSYSKFPTSIKLLKADDEVYQGRICAEEIWTAITNRSKKSKKYQLMGNHDDRPYKRMSEAYPELAPFCDFTSLWKFHGVETVHDSKDSLLIEDIYFFHGYKTKWLEHAKRVGKSVVFGHTHRGGCLSLRDGDSQIFELNAGYLADPFHPALMYRDMKQFFDWTHGIGFIDNFGPRFISL